MIGFKELKPLIVSNAIKHGVINKGEEISLSWTKFMDRTIVDIISMQKSVDKNQLARDFHEIYESLAPIHDWKTQKKSRVEYDDLPTPNRNLMLATCQAILNKYMVVLKD